MAARAYDVAARCLKGKAAVLNFPELVDVLPRPNSPAPRDIQAAAAQAAATCPSVKLGIRNLSDSMTESPGDSSITTSSNTNDSQDINGDDSPHGLNEQQDSEITAGIKSRIRSAWDCAHLTQTQVLPSHSCASMAIHELGDPCVCCMLDVCYMQSFVDLPFDYRQCFLTADANAEQRGYNLSSSVRDGAPGSDVLDELLLWDYSQ
ncbi:hypothetical protein KP509_38G045600 [Ceratopteris richardii]|nr:hypothetical protein KP509_38G045600 [Ceratopteris richardii]